MTNTLPDSRGEHDEAGPIMTTEVLIHLLEDTLHLPRLGYMAECAEKETDREVFRERVRNQQRHVQLAIKALKELPQKDPDQ